MRIFTEKDKNMFWSWRQEVWLCNWLSCMPWSKELHLLDRQLPGLQNGICVGRRVPHREECLLWLTNVDGSWKDIKKSKAHNMKLALQGSLVTFQGKISQGGADKNCDLERWWVFPWPLTQGQFHFLGRTYELQQWDHLSVCLSEKGNISVCPTPKIVHLQL